MVNRPFLDSQQWQKQQWRADRQGAHPDLIEFEKAMLRRMGKLGVPMYSPEFVRSGKRQDDLFALGVTKARAGQSAHQFGCALDLVHSIKQWNLGPKGWALIGHIGKELIQQKGLAVHSLAWGGDWSFYDPAHWQIIDWKTEKEHYPWPTTK